MKFWTQFGLLLLVAGIAVLITVLASIPGQVLMEVGYRSLGCHWMQWMQTIVLMIMAPLCWYRWYHLTDVQKAEGKWKECFKEARLTSINWRYMFVTFCLMLVAMPMMDSLEVFMNRLPWPEPIHDYIVEGFSRNQVMIGYLLAPEGVAAATEQFLLMCLFTAIGEELMFRGALLSCFRNTTHLNIHVIAIIIGFIFALIHFEPAGFVLRMMLGALFVYLVWWSGSLWPSIMAHCMNNSFALIGYSLSSPEERSSLAVDYTFGPIMTAISLLSAVVLLYVLWQMRSKIGEKNSVE